MLLARMVGTTGRVLGLDIDKIALQIATQESRDAGLAQVEFRESDACAIDAGNDNDIVYSRFLLSHVPQPLKAIDSMRAALGASGTIIIEDIDFHGHFCFPHNATFDEYVKLFQMTARARGADPEIGPKLPGMLATAGFKDISVRVAQPAAIAGETKAINALTLDAIGQSAITCGFATEVQIDRLSRELWRLAHDLETLMSIARVIQITARKC
jgi:ubiquinone/menaquinone biosynthesis C-methylase UbiE